MAKNLTKKRDEVTPCNAWWCLECSPALEMTYAAMRTHLVQKHGLKLEGLIWQKKMLMHLDADTWWQSSYQVIIPMPDGKELQLQNEVIMRRAKDCMMRHE